MFNSKFYALNLVHFQGKQQVLNLHLARLRTRVDSKRIIKHNPSAS